MYIQIATKNNDVMVIARSTEEAGNVVPFFL